MARRRPWLVRVTWPSKVLRFGFTNRDRAERYAEAVGGRGAVAEMLDSFTGELILKTGERLPFTFIPVTTYQVAGGRPGTIPGIGPFTPGVADFPAEWVAPDGRTVLGGFVRFTGAQPGGATLGASTLVYRFTVSGVDKASIDTGVDAAQAGSGDFTNGDLLEMYFYARTDEAAEESQTNFTFNNDAAANYDQIRLLGQGGAASSASSTSRNNIFANVAGSNAAANIFATVKFALPNYTGTTGFKPGDMTVATLTSAAGGEISVWTTDYHSTTAVTRVAVTPNTAGRKLKVGTQLLIYKRLAS